MRDAPTHIDEGEVTELAVGALEAHRQLGGDLEGERWRFVRQLAEPRIGHLRDLGTAAGTHEGSALVDAEQPHLAEELPFREIGQHDLVAAIVLDEHFDRTGQHVVQLLGGLAGADEDGLRRHGPSAGMLHEEPQPWRKGGRFAADGGCGCHSQ